MQDFRRCGAWSNINLLLVANQILHYGTKTMKMNNSFEFDFFLFNVKLELNYENFVKIYIS